MRARVIAVAVAAVVLSLAFTPVRGDEVGAGAGSGSAASELPCPYEIGFSVERNNRYGYYLDESHFNVELRKAPAAECGADYPESESLGCDDYAWTPEAGGGDYDGWIACGYSFAAFIKVGAVGAPNALGAAVNPATHFEYCRYLEWDTAGGGYVCSVSPYGETKVHIVGSVAVATQHHEPVSMPYL